LFCIFSVHFDNRPDHIAWTRTIPPSLKCPTGRFSLGNIVRSDNLAGRTILPATPGFWHVLSYIHVRNPVWIETTVWLYLLYIYVIQWYIESCKMLFIWKKNRC